ncbi:MAG: WYL domain-containing protein [Actinomycetia bacterium]|jgi:proteasome accessory factor C|nr:WYL domain-containing protein [Actinomycetes bacterium]
MTEQTTDRIARLLALVPWLISRPGITLTDTAGHFGITVESLTKDLWQLVLCGLPGYGPDQLIDIDFWDDDRIWVQDPQTLAKPMRINAEEAVALAIALRRMNQIPGVSDKDSISRLIAKLDAVIGTNAQILEISESDHGHNGALVEQALKDELGLEFDYASAQDDQSHRVVMPIRVFSVDDYLYLAAWCEQAEAIRSFRFDRISELSLHAPLENIPGNLTEEVTGLADLTLAPTALIRIDSEISWVTEEVWVNTVNNPHVVLEEGQSLIRVPYLSKDWLIRWVFSMAGAAVVLEPVEIAGQIREIVEESLVRLQH